VAGGQGERPGPELAGDRASRILGVRAGDGRRGVAIATTSTLVFFTAIVVLIVTSPGWDEVRNSFFNWEILRASFPDIVDAFLLNVKIFSIAEALILVTALALALIRSLPGPVFFPLRALGVAYTDLFRGVPTILVIYILGFGAPALQLEGVPNSPMFWGITALVLVYTAYVAEVYRAGIESVHPSQEAAARSLGLTRGQSLQYVIIPQAVRRVVPPLLNDFIGLQKDSALVALIGPIEAFRQSQIEVAGSFNYTPYLITAAMFILLTIPLARFTDWLVARDRRRLLAGAGP
jgi:polar amino acid transport system permease protein